MLPHASPGSPPTFATCRSIGGYDQWESILREKPDSAVIIKALKAVIPGGSAVPVVPGEIMMETEMDYDSLAKAGSMLGSGAVIVIAEVTCMVKVLANISHFYAAESCGQCTPCREGTGWLSQVVQRILDGQGRPEDLDLLDSVAGRIGGRTICALGDAAAMPVQRFIKHYRHELEYLIAHGGSLIEAA